MAMQRGRVNPYKLGIELLRDVERRWNTGQFGKEWERMRRFLTKKRKLEPEFWASDARKSSRSARFITILPLSTTFLTPEFCQEHKMFSFAHNEQQNNYVIESREFDKVKQRLLFSLTNFGKPFIYVIERKTIETAGELLLQHGYNGIELRMGPGPRHLG